MNLFGNYNAHLNCCDDSCKVKFLILEFDKNISIEDLKKCTTDKDYILFNARIITQDCWYHIGRKNLWLKKNH